MLLILSRYNLKRMPERLGEFVRNLTSSNLRAMANWNCWQRSAYSSLSYITVTSYERHNVSNHGNFAVCLIACSTNSKESSKLHISDRPVPCGFLPHKASSAESPSRPWRCHGGCPMLLHNTLTPRQSGRDFADIFNCIFVNKMFKLMFISKG